MSLQRSIELLHSFSHDKTMIGATLVGAVSHLIAQEVRATRADKEQVSDIPEVDTYPSDAGDVLFLVHTGLFQKVGKVKNRLGPKLAHMGPSVYIDHTSNIEASKAAEIAAVQKEAGRRLVEICISRGGKKHVQMMTDPEFRQERGSIELTDFESVPFTWNHVRWRGKAMGRSALMLPDSHTLATLFSRYMEAKEQEIGEAFVRGTEPDDFYGVREGIRGLQAQSPEAAAIREAFSEENVGHIITMAAPGDRIVKTKRSHEWLERATGRKIPSFIDTDREPGDHAGITDKPELQVQQIERILAGDYEPQELVDAA